MTKLRLLNDGGYYGFDMINFPIVVDGEKDPDHNGYDIPLDQLRKLGCEDSDNKSLFFITGSECEVISDDL
jgi:hypothetical protein